MTEPYVSIKNMNVEFGARSGLPFGQSSVTRAVIDASLSIDDGEAVGLVGESGSGKSTVANTLVGLVKPTSGTVTIGGIDVPARSSKDKAQLRRSVQMVFQDPYASLHPRMTLWKNVAEAWRAHPDLVTKSNWRSSAEELLDTVGIPAEMASRYPRQLSGGQRQRVAIARALAVQPRLLICDEPTSALDVSVQAQIINLLKDIADARNLAMLFISHDLAVVRQVSDRVAVMYRGEIVEQGEAAQVYSAPAHAYTRELFEASASLGSSQD